MTLGFGLLGALVFLLAMLFLPLRLSLRLAYPGVSVAQVRLYAWTLSRWSSLPELPLQRQSPPAKPDGNAQESGSGPNSLRSIEAFSAFLSPLRSAPVGALRIVARGSTGDPATTALLYGAAWSVLGTFLAARGLRPQELSLQPQLLGPAEVNAYGEAEVQVTLLSLAAGALHALRRLKAPIAG
ncbi:MAG: DUF2953 domain-containing protein [Thermaerobacter sp.]|nr:DUF2953 domain-containing protein [Thermaerobacter sp.]